jgi:hypothetical protein
VAARSSPQENLPVATVPRTAFGPAAIFLFELP